MGSEQSIALSTVPGGPLKVSSKIAGIPKPAVVGKLNGCKAAADMYKIEREPRALPFHGTELSEKTSLRIGSGIIISCISVISLPKRFASHHYAFQAIRRNQTRAFVSFPGTGERAHVLGELLKLHPDLHRRANSISMNLIADFAIEAVDEEVTAAKSNLRR